MKKLIRALCERLGRIAKDKYQHFAAGAVTAAAMLLAPLLMGAPAWLALLLSVAAVVAVAVIKERRIDPQPDARDIAATLLGAAVVWGTVLTVLVIV